MTATPLVSIIIPTYNRAHLIGETLDSVLAQTYTNWECIVVDDGSTDNTEEVLKKYCDKEERIKYHHRPINRPKGANSCRNYGFELSKGEYVNWFDSDDLMMRDFIRIKLEAFSNEINLVICSGFIVNEFLKNKKVFELKENPDLFKDYVLWKFQAITDSVIFRRSFLINKNLFLNKIKRGQETEFFSRLFFKLSEKSYKIINIPLFLYRQHQDTKTAKNQEYIKSYKESQAFIAVENLKKSIQLKDKLLINSCFKLLIFYFFRGIENRHYNNSRFILNKLILLLFKSNKRLSIELLSLGNFLLLINKNSYRIEKRFRNYEF
ncbi:glycosyltransferase family 2 protein [Lutibacter agarilyticus]|nr:glycosyltransferase family 2 protein [Lutibacter agarilyticus]